MRATRRTAAVTLALNGTFTYTPDADFNGTDSFTYEAFDGGRRDGDGYDHRHRRKRRAELHARR